MDWTPRGFVWDGTYHPVRVVALTWYEDRGWWLWRTWRAYYRLLTRTGLAVEVHQDCSTHKWYVQRLYD